MRTTPTTGLGVTVAGAGINIALSAAKITAGLMFHCQTVLADGVHSLSDLISDLAVLISIHWGNQPPDEKHPYGHRRVHNLAGLSIGIMLLVTSVWIGYRAVTSLFHLETGIVGWIPLALAAATVPAKEWLYHWTRRVGLRTHNSAIAANAWHHRTDAFTSLAASAGIAGAMFLGGDWAILDPVCAFLLAGLLAASSLRMLYQTANELMDRAPHKAELAAMERVIQETPGVLDYHAIRARRTGGLIEMDIHIQVEGSLTVAQGHAIAGRVRHRMFEAEPSLQEVIIHIEPYEPTGKCQTVSDLNYERDE